MTIQGGGYTHRLLIPIEFLSDKFLILNESINTIYRVQSKYFSVIILDKSKLQMEFLFNFFLLSKLLLLHAIYG